MEEKVDTKEQLAGGLLEVLEQRLAGAPDVSSIVQTDGEGRCIASSGEAPGGERAVAEAVDIAASAWSELARRIGVGDVQVALIACSDGVLLAGHMPSQGHITVIGGAESKSAIGLLLSQLNRSLSTTTEGE